MHSLRFWSNPGLENSEKQCAKCLRKAYCRYVCEECRNYYCLRCVPPKLANYHKSYFPKLAQYSKSNFPTHCPAGHKVEMRLGGGYVCTVCIRDSITLKNTEALYCSECDFNICKDCLREYKMAPQECYIF